MRIVAGERRYCDLLGFDCEATLMPANGGAIVYASEAACQKLRRTERGLGGRRLKEAIMGSVSSVPAGDGRQALFFPAERNAGATDTLVAHLNASLRNIGIKSVFVLLEPAS